MQYSIPNNIKILIHSTGYTEEDTKPLCYFPCKMYFKHIELLLFWVPLTCMGRWPYTYN